MSTDAIARAADAIADADALVITAGAGMGVDSGLPDFRGNDGFWRAYPALGDIGMPFTSVASPSTFRGRPALAWGFYGHRLALYRRTVPHSGFDILLRWAGRIPRGAFVFTSNVDGQFQTAGFDPDRIYECHGSIHHLQCLTPCRDAIWDATSFVPDVDDAVCELRGAGPMCARCGGLARPNVLMFGDGGWLEGRTAAQGARLDRWLEDIERPTIVEIGAGTAIPSVRHFGERLARRYGRPLVRINPREPGVPDPKDVGLALGARTALTAVDAALPPR
jgi:NAD-dependent SIR2 family protein deacetylase